MPSVLYIQYADPRVYPPVERGAAILHRTGWDVSFLAVAAQGQSAALTEGGPDMPIERLRHAKGGFAALRSYVLFWRRAMTKARAERPDIVYCSDLLSYPAGWLVARYTACRTVLHEHDSPVGEGGNVFQRWLAAMRVRFARMADIVVLPQTARAASFEQATGVAPTIVHNCPSLAEIEPAASAASGKELVLWHHGSLNRSRFPPAIIEALARLPDKVSLEIAGYETPNSAGFVDGLLRRAEELGVRDRITFHGALPREELFARARRADIGITLFARDFGEPMVGASVKPFDYLACGLPLLVNDTAEWREFFTVRDVAISCDPDRPENIAAAISQFHSDPKLRENMARRGAVLLHEHWNYEAQFAPVVEKMTAFANGKGGAA